MNTGNALTRAEAHELIIERRHGGADPLVCLLDLQQHWIGHRDYMEADSVTESADDVAATLHEYVDECDCPQNDRTQRDTDPTDLTDPEA